MVIPNKPIYHQLFGLPIQSENPTETQVPKKYQGKLLSNSNPGDSLTEGYGVSAQHNSHLYLKNSMKSFPRQK